ncbi:CGNR zinc finger domain-containing protein [Kribbella qitaiheensis]|uniref:CGNR zinc finger domain-containing protein n=1 Tax=Kribbella qitaiheensis TaxID=1544730 RepID=UPI001FEC8EFC|nr:CGNR zinc finger domain-containing protein [Kribbella qitaiheensis]
MKFDSHVLSVLTTSVDAVNRLTGGHALGQPFEAPTGAGKAAAVAEALSADGRSRPEVSAADAEVLVAVAVRMREVFEAAHAGDLDRAAKGVNALLIDTDARPQLDKAGELWNLHFHGPDDTLARGWAAGWAAGLAIALGSDLAGRLGVCAAPYCDRVFVDESKNSRRRFCSPQCQSRVKAAAHRARQQAG